MADLDAVQIRQAEIEQDEVDVAVRRGRERGAAVALPRNLVTVQAEGRFEDTADRVVVFHHQQFRHAGELNR